MDNLLSNIDQTKKKQNNFLSNYDIQKIYLNNEYSDSDVWMNEVFKNISYIAISRIKKYKNFSEKEDLLQTLYLSIWEAIKTFDPHKNFDFYRWLSWHMNRHIRNFMNAKQRFYSINLLNDSTLIQTNLEDRMILLKDILEHTKAVSERDCRMIYSYYFEGYTLSEIGQREGLSVEGVRKVHHKIIEKYRRRIQLGDK